MAKGLTGKSAEAKAELEEHLTRRQPLVERWDRNWRAYRGEMESRSQAAQWTHKLTAPYAQHIIEMTVSGMLDERLRFKVEPRPRLYDPGQYELAAVGAEALEILLGWQLQQDRFDEKQRDLVLQERVCHLSPMKVYWRRSVRMRKRRVHGAQMVFDPDTGAPLGMIPHVQITEDPEPAYDGPCVEVIDVNDFCWDASAKNLESCSIVAHRTWHTMEELQRLAKQYPNVYGNVGEIPDPKGRGGGVAMETAMGLSERARDRVEVWEVWRREAGKIRVYLIAEREVLLSQRDNPYWHGEFPFLVFSSQREPLRMHGNPQIERIADLQEAIWSFSNLRLDATLLATMPITMFSSDFEDPDSFEFGPWARNVVDRPDQVVMWSPDARVAQNSLAAESILKQDMQNLAGGFPFTSSSEARNVQANTATEASLVASIAQRSLVSAKTSLYQVYERMGQMMLELNQQFVTDPVYVSVVGVDTEQEIREIVPQMLEGDFAFSIQPMAESMIRQERRAEAQTLYTALIQALPVLLATGVNVNAKALVEDLLEAFDKQSTDRYFQPAQPMQPQQGGGIPGMGSLPNPANQPGGGVTNPALAAGPLAPSNNYSVNPASMMQQSGAMTGAGRSV